MPRDRALLDWLRIDRKEGAPIQQQIGDQLRAAIQDGRLPPGTLLPSSRNLAADLSIARGTALTVYDRLLGEGLLQVRERSAVFVADVAARESSIARGLPAGAVVEMSKRATEPPLRQTAFLTGVPAFDVFPAARWARLLSARAVQVSVDMVGEGRHAAGYPPLQAALAAHLRTARGVLCEPHQVVIAGSARAALSMLARLLTKPGDRCLVEDPGYLVTRRILRDCGVEPVPVGVDANGMKLGPSVPNARLVYLTPTHQMPFGVRLGDDRCAFLLEWAKQQDAWIIEDDYDSEFRYVGEPVVALQHSDPNGRVIHVGTFSKTLFPGLRIAYAIMPEALAKPAADAIYLHGQAPVVHVQAALADFMAQGHYARHIWKARSVYRRRQGLLVTALNRHLEGIIAPVFQPAGGMNLIVPFPPDIPVEQIQWLARETGISVRPVSYYTEGTPAPNAFHLGFAAVPERVIEPSVVRLAAVVRASKSGSAQSR
jgi:GntR family transcriptional regulator / MocR family aminotransferase